MSTAPPWTLHGHAHALLLALPGAGRDEVAGGISARRGGLALLLFVRYTQSNVGPYDELAWLLPWGLDVRGRRVHTVTRIFVSSAASCDAGRRNWGIPKQLARFEVSGTRRHGQRVRVCTPDGARIASFVVEPLGRAKLALPRVPEVVRRLGQVQDEQLFELSPRVRGQLGRARFSQLDVVPERFVDLRRARRLGAVSLHDLELVFPVARVSSAARG